MSKKPDSRPLTGKQEAFVLEYAQSMSATIASKIVSYPLQGDTPCSGWYVYFLIDPRDDSVFYVGKGKGGRMFHHARRAYDGAKEGNAAKKQRIIEIHASGAEVLELVFAVFGEEDLAFECEGALIYAWRKIGLLNIAKGVVPRRRAEQQQAKLMLSRLKRVEDWLIGMSEADRRVATNVFGSPELCYSFVSESLASISNS